jgi:hypothetical protein
MTIFPYRSPCLSSISMISPCFHGGFANLRWQPSATSWEGSHRSKGKWPWMPRTMRCRECTGDPCDQKKQVMRPTSGRNLWSCGKQNECALPMFWESTGPSPRDGKELKQVEAAQNPRIHLTGHPGVRSKHWTTPEIWHETTMNSAKNKSYFSEPISPS